MLAQPRTSAINCIAGVPYLRLSLQDADGSTAITPRLLDTLLCALDEVNKTRFVLIEGGTGSFCRGLHLEQLIDVHPMDGVLEQFAHLLDSVAHVPVPVIALVNGESLGGGVGLAAVADLVLASPRASFALPEAIMGLIPAVIFPYVARRIGVPRARLMALGLRPLDAQTALAWGLVDEVASGDLHTTLHAHARRFSYMAPHAIAAMKALVQAHFSMPDDYVQAATSTFYECLASPETRQRLQRFIEGEIPWLEERAT